MSAFHNERDEAKSNNRKEWGGRRSFGYAVRGKFTKQQTARRERRSAKRDAHHG